MLVLKKIFNVSRSETVKSLVGPFLCKPNSFPLERFCTRSGFETEAQGDSEMGC